MSAPLDEYVVGCAPPLWETPDGGRRMDAAFTVFRDNHRIVLGPDEPLPFGTCPLCGRPFAQLLVGSLDDFHPVD